MVCLDYKRNVAILKLNRAVTYAVNLDLIEHVSRNIQKIIDNPKVHGLILTSTNEKFVSIEKF